MTKPDENVDSQDKLKAVMKKREEFEKNKLEHEKRLEAEKKQLDLELANVLTDEVKNEMVKTLTDIGYFVIIPEKTTKEEFIDIGIKTGLGSKQGQLLKAFKTFIDTEVDKRKADNKIKSTDINEMITLWEAHKENKNKKIYPIDVYINYISKKEPKITITE